MQELETRVNKAYATTSRAGLVRLLEDLPDARLRPSADARAQWRAPFPAAHAAADLLAYVGLVLQGHGYSLQTRSPDRVVFSRRAAELGCNPLVSSCRSVSSQGSESTRR
jgi:hypothetical protein